MDDLIDSETVADLTLHVEAISKHVPLRPIRTEHDYDAAVASMNRLLDAGAADEAHPLADLVATLGELIGDYDAVNYRSMDRHLNFLLNNEPSNQAPSAPNMNLITREKNAP